MKRSIRFDELMGRRDLLMGLLALSLALDVILGTALAVKAMQRRPVLVLPAGHVAVPGEVTDDAARAFARAYVSTFDTYTPATLPASTEWLKQRIAPSTYTQAAEALDRRLAVAREGRMSSMAVPVEEGRVDRAAGVEVTLRARRTIFIADRLSKEATATYRIGIRMVPPTPANPSGLAVTRQDVTEESHEDPR